MGIQECIINVYLTILFEWVRLKEHVFKTDNNISEEPVKLQAVNANIFLIFFIAFTFSSQLIATHRW